MSEMVERVARALCEEKLWPGAFEKEAPSNQDAWRSEARAAIEAMREPTKAMLKAMYRRNDDNDHEQATLENWQDAIDAALKD